MLSISISGPVAKFADIKPAIVSLRGYTGAAIKRTVAIRPLPKYPFRIVDIEAKHGQFIKFDLKNDTTPGKKGYLLFAKGMNQRRNSWQVRVPVRVRAMVLAQDRLFIAGPPDIVEPEDPLGAFEGRKGGQLWVVDAQTGEAIAKHDLDAPPVFHGAAAADGQLYIVDERGSIVCFAAP